MKKKKKLLPSQILRSKLEKLEISEDIYKDKPFDIKEFRKLAAEVRKTFTNEELLSKGIIPFT